MKHVCLGCKTEFVSRSTKRQYCSHGCYSKSRIGEKRPNQNTCGDKNPNWRGGRRIDKSGYVLIHSPQHPFGDFHGYVREHRLVMEKQLLRFLQPEEVVHHLNEIVSDNRIENLQLMSKEEHDRLPGHFNDRNPELLRSRLEKTWVTNTGKKKKNNTSGFVGVRWSKASKKWIAEHSLNKKIVYIGRFKKLEDAVFVRALIISAVEKL